MPAVKHPTEELFQHLDVVFRVRREKRILHAVFFQIAVEVRDPFFLLVPVGQVEEDAHAGIVVLRVCFAELRTACKAPAVPHVRIGIGRVCIRRCAVDAVYGIYNVIIIISVVGKKRPHGRRRKDALGHAERD